MRRACWAAGFFLVALHCATILEPTPEHPLRQCLYDGSHSKWEHVSVVGTNPGNIDEWLVRFDDRQYDEFYRGKTFNVPKSGVTICRGESLIDQIDARRRDP